MGLGWPQPPRLGLAKVVQGNPPSRCTDIKPITVSCSMASRRRAGASVSTDVRWLWSSASRRAGSCWQMLESDKRTTVEVVGRKRKGRSAAGELLHASVRACRRGRGAATRGRPVERDTDAMRVPRLVNARHCSGAVVCSVCSFWRCGVCVRLGS